MITVIIFGVSGVGKTHLINLTLPRLRNARAFRASELIGLARANADPEYLRNLGHDEMHRSQELLVRGYHEQIQAISADIVLLDAHSVIDQDSGFYDIPVDVISRLNANWIVHVEDNVDQIMKRRQMDTGRLRPARSLEQLAAYQTRSRSICETYGRTLNVPMLEVHSGDEDALVEAIRMSSR